MAEQTFIYYNIFNDFFTIRKEIIMKYFEKYNTIHLTEQDSFDIEQTLECGQCFRFEKTGEKEYRIVAKGRVLNIKQTEDETVFFPCTASDFENIWYDYFDFGRDYGKIKEAISDDITMQKAIDFGGGIRILNQEPFECLISFIISQNNRIPMIKKVIKNISERWGVEADGEYLFPNVDRLINSDMASLMECKTGFRHKYITDCLNKIKSGEIDLEGLKSKDTETVKKELMTIKGVGTKVADCVLLFSFGRSEVFPTDVWIKRVMEHIYFEDRDEKISDIHSFAKEKWGEYAGFAQQYLFYYARTLKISKN